MLGAIVITSALTVYVMKQRQLQDTKPKVLLLSFPEEVQAIEPNTSMYLHQFGDTLQIGFEPFDSTDQEVFVLP